MDEKLKSYKEQFEGSIPTSFTEYNKQAVMNQIKNQEPSHRKNFLPKALSVVALAIACLFIFFIFNNDHDGFIATKSNDNENEQRVAEDDQIQYDYDPDITGYIMEKSGDSILVVSNEPVDYSANGGLEEFYNAIHFSNAPEDVEIGDYVQVWAKDGVAESYPGQASVGSLEVKDIKEHEGAQMTEAEAIRKIIEYGIETGEFPDHIVAIKGINFDLKMKTWTSEFFDTETNTTFQIGIQDQQPEAKPVGVHETLLILNGIHSPFDLETVQIDDVAGHFLVTDVKDSGEDKTIIFEPSQLHPLSGTLIKTGEWKFRMNVPNLEDIGLFPVAEDDIGSRVQFNFEDKDTIEILDLRFIDEKIIDNVNIKISKVVYEYSVTEASNIILYVDQLSLEDAEYELQILDTTVELDEDLKAIYEQYSEKHDDELLSELEPIQVFKLYAYASSIEDLNTTYKLYLNNDTTIVPSEEEYNAESAEVLPFDFYNELKDIDEFIQLKDGDDALIRYDHYPFAYFSLGKDQTDNIWKVSFMPLQ